MINANYRLPFCTYNKVPTARHSTHVCSGECHYNYNHLFLLLLLHLLHQHTALLVLASFILEPYTDHPWTEAGHFDKLLLHQGIWTRVGAVTCTQRVQLLLVQHSPHACCLLVRLVRPWPRTTTAATARCRHRCDGGCIRMSHRQSTVVDNCKTTTTFYFWMSHISQIGVVRQKLLKQVDLTNS